MPSEARHMRDGAEDGPRSTGPRLVRAWSTLDREQHLAAAAAVLLFATMLLPWYQQNAVVTAAKVQPLVSRNLSAFAVFSFVEAAVLLVAVAVLFLLYERGEGRTFHLPGSDGAVIFAAGIWTAVLLVWRLFDKPGIAHNGVASNIGIQWGIFFALGAAGLLAYAGSRMRAGRRPEAPLLRDEPVAPPRRRPRAAATDADAAPSWEEQDPPAAPSWEEQDPPAAQPDERNAAHADERAAAYDDDADATVVVPRRPRYPPSPPAKPRPRAATPASAEQLSFEDTPPGA